MVGGSRRVQGGVLGGFSGLENVSGTSGSPWQGRLRGILGTRWGSLDRILGGDSFQVQIGVAPVGLSWGVLGGHSAVLGAYRAILVYPRAVLGALWAVSGPSSASLGSPVGERRRRAGRIGGGLGRAAGNHGG